MSVGAGDNTYLLLCIAFIASKPYNTAFCLVFAKFYNVCVYVLGVGGGKGVALPFAPLSPTQPGQRVYS
jgi:hypothetical protein